MTHVYNILCTPALHALSTLEVENNGQVIYSKFLIVKFTTSFVFVSHFVPYNLYSVLLWKGHYKHMLALQWRHNESNVVSNHRCLYCLLNRLFRRRSKKTSKLHVTGLCEGNTPVTGVFPNGTITRKMFPFYDAIMPWVQARGWCLLCLEPLIIGPLQAYISITGKILKETWIKTQLYLFKGMYLKMFAKYQPFLMPRSVK